MILIISTCSEKLSEDEFVRPIAEIIMKDYEIKQYDEKIDIKKYKHIIICGTALKDNNYLKNIDYFEFLKEVHVPVLGICSGMQIVGLIYGAKLGRKTEIGMIDIKTNKANHLFEGNFWAYAIHRNSLSDLKNFEILAESKSCVQAIMVKHKEIYGIMFHPEVRNSQIIHNFLTI